MTDRHEMVKHYLDQMCSQVKAREVHTDLRDELGNHMEEMMLDKQQEGLSQEEAAAYAIEQMGDPAVVGKSMHRLHRYRMHWGLLVGLAAMASISLLLIWVFVNYIGDEKFQGLYTNQIVFTLMGLVIMVFFIIFDYQKWRKVAWLIYILINVALWISPMVAFESNGLKRFWVVPGFTIDVNGIASWILPLAIGAIMFDRIRSNVTIKSTLIYIALMTLPVILLVQLSDWVRLVLFSITCILLFAWSTRKWFSTLVGAMLVGISVVLSLLLTNRYGRMERFIAGFDLQHDPNGNYYNRSIIDVFQSAGWWGNGFGNTFKMSQINYLDHPAVLLIDVFGWFAGVFFLLIIIWFVASMLKTLLRIKDEFGRMIVVSITVMFALQMIYSLAMTTGKVPIISIAFPIIGHGGHLVFEYALLGLLLGVYRRKDTISKKNEKMRQKVDADPMTSL